MRIEQLIMKHPCFIGDLKVASDLLMNKRPIVANALAEYAEALAEYDTDDPFAALKQPEPWENEWNVSPEGDIQHKDNLYLIEAERLGKDNWLDHMAGKRWVNLNTFIPAYIVACSRAGIKNVKIAY